MQSDRPGFVTIYWGFVKSTIYDILTNIAFLCPTDGGSSGDTVVSARKRTDEGQIIRTAGASTGSQSVPRVLYEGWDGEEHECAGLQRRTVQTSPGRLERRGGDSQTAGVLYGCPW